MSMLQDLEDLTKRISISEEVEYGPNNWKVRRRIIIAALILSATVFLAISGLLAFSMLKSIELEKPIALDGNIADLASSILWSVISFAAAIISAYVFGSTMDTKDYRNKLNDLIKNTPSSQKTIKNTEQPQG